jgi:hypothetical protein
MGFVVANGANSSTAAFALPNLTTVLICDVVGFDPLTTILAYAIYLILCFVFEKLAIPILFEILIKQLINMLEIDMIIGATSRRHMRRVRD